MRRTTSFGFSGRRHCLVEKPPSALAIAADATGIFHGEKDCATATALPPAGGIGGAAVALALEQTPSIDDKILLLQPTPLLPEGLELAMRAHHGTCEGFGGTIFNGASGSNVEV